MKKSSLIKFITILSLSSTLLSADTFSLKVAKQRDVLRDSNVTLYVNVKPKDINSSYNSYYNIYTYDKEGNKKSKEYFEDNNKTESCNYSYDKNSNEWSIK